MSETERASVMNETPEPAMLAVLNGRKPARTPVWLMRQAGRYLPEYKAIRAKAGSFLVMCHTPDYATEVTLQPLRRFDLDAAIIFSDILVIPEAMGQPLRFVEGEGPQLDALSGVAAIEQLSFDIGRLDKVYEAIRQTRAALPAEKALIGFAGAPWTLACYMMEGGGSKDFLAARRLAAGDPAGFRKLIAKLVDAVIEHLSAQIRAGADVVQIFDSWAGATSAEQFAAYCAAPVRAIVQTLKTRHPNVRVIGFPRGAGSLYAGYAEATGVDAVSIDYQTPAAWAREAIAAPTVLQGNLDPALLVTGGAAMLDAIDRIKADLGPDRLIFNLGHGVPQQTPPDHVAALVERVHAA